jgi:hypothetical protein
MRDESESEAARPLPLRPPRPFAGRPAAACRRDASLACLPRGTSDLPAGLVSAVSAMSARRNDSRGDGGGGSVGGGGDPLRESSRTPGQMARAAEEAEPPGAPELKRRGIRQVQLPRRSASVHASAGLGAGCCCLPLLAGSPLPLHQSWYASPAHSTCLCAHPWLGGGASACSSRGVSTTRRRSPSTSRSTSRRAMTTSRH